MDLEQKLDAFQQKYDDLEEQAEPGSVERSVYNQIAALIRKEQDLTPALNRAANTRIWLVDLAKELNSPVKRSMVRQAIRELEQIASLPPLR